jgi:arylsulfatase A-like enzyme
LNETTTTTTPCRRLSISVAGFVTAGFLLGIELALGGLRGALAEVSLGNRLLLAAVTVGGSIVLAAIAGAAVSSARALPRIAMPSVRVAFAGVVAAGTALLLRDLFSGPRASRLPLAAGYPWALGLVAAAGCDVVVRIARRSAVAAGLLAFLVAVTAAVLDARVWPGLYPSFHRYLDFVILAAVPLGAVLVSPAPPPRARSGLRFAAFVMLLLGAGSAWELGRDPVLGGEVRRAALVVGRLMPQDGEAAPAVPDDVEADPTDEAHRAAAGLHRAAVSRAASRPSILLVTVDALRADRGPGSPGGDAMMPLVAAWAREGAVFTRAYSAAVSTFPSCRATLTGRYPDTSEKDALLPEARVIPGELKRLGYRTLFLTGFDILNRADQRWLPALDGAYDEIASGLRTPALADRARELLASPAPWFLWIHPREAHLPYEDATGYTPGDSIEARYDAACRFLDGVLGPLLESAPRDVWVILAADHGEDLPSEHGFSSHGASVYEGACHVPLVVRGPGVRVARVDALASLVDLFPTVLGIAGIADPPQSDGLSLLPAVFGGAAYLGKRDAVFVERRYGNVLDPVPNPMRAMVSGTRKIILTERPRSFEAYDLAADPKETRNLFLADPDAAHALHARLNTRFRARMTRWAAPGVEASLDYDAALGGDPARLVALADSPDARVRRLAARDLSHAPTPAQKADLLRLAESEDPSVRAWAAVGLGRLAAGDEAWPSALALQGPDAGARESAVEILMESPRLDAVPALWKLFDDEQPSLSWKPIVAMTGIGHILGVKFAGAAFREADPLMLGVNSIVARLGRHPRPEFPALLEELYGRKHYDITLVATLTAISAELPSTRMLRILDGIEQEFPPLSADVEKRRAEIRSAFSKARAKWAAGGPPPHVDDSVFEVAWGMVPGVNFVVPPEGALDPDQWGAFYDTFPVRFPRGPAFDVQVSRTRGPEARGFLQLYSRDPGTATITAGALPEIALPFDKGPNVIAFPVPPADQDGILRVSVRLAGAAADAVGLRELILSLD